MRGKIRNIRRKKFEVIAQSSMSTHSEHAIRNTSTNAILYPDSEGRVREVCLDEDDIRSHYGQSRITDKLLSRLNDDLHNKYINYVQNDDGEYVIEGSIENYV